MTEQQNLPALHAKLEVSLPASTCSHGPCLLCLRILFASGHMLSRIVPAAQNLFSHRPIYPSQSWGGEAPWLRAALELALLPISGTRYGAEPHD